jgi:hypothetical protein
MLLKNNSRNEWLQYNCGHCLVDIKAESVFNVDEEAGAVILRNLGAPNWVVKLDQSNVHEELGVSLEDKPKELPKQKGCDVCGSKGYIHKKGCSLAK